MDAASGQVLRVYPARRKNAWLASRIPSSVEVTMAILFAAAIRPSEARALSWRDVPWLITRSLQRSGKLPASQGQRID